MFLSLLLSVPSQTCVPRGSFTPIYFDFATVVRSNLGGIPGRCVDAGECEELQSASTPNEIFLRNVGYYPDPDTPGATPLSLRITNETEYRAWNPRLNGINRRGGSPTASFGIVNLLGPRAVGTARSWDPALTFVQLRYEFLDATTGL